MTCKTVFALISTHFIRQSSNLTQISTSYVNFFCTLWIKVQKSSEKSLFLLWSESTEYVCKNIASLWRLKSNFSRHFQRMVDKIWNFFRCIVLIHVKLELCQIKCVEMRAKTVLQVKLHYFQCNFVRLHVFPKFTCCNCLNCQNQYYSILWIFSKCSGISEIFPPVWALRVHRSP